MNSMHFARENDFLLCLGWQDVRSTNKPFLRTWNIAFLCLYRVCLFSMARLQFILCHVGILTKRR